MSPLITTLLIVTGALALAFRRSALTTWTAFGFGVMALIHLLGTGLSWFTWSVFVVVAVILNVRPLRRRLLSAHLLRWFRNVLPPMSATEKEAIDAGTVWWDAELFSGRPDWRRLLDTPSPELTAEEKAFLDGPTAELCRMLDDWKIENETGDLPPEVWDFIKKNRFFGMIIPKQYDGLEFSARAQSDVIIKIASRSVAAAVTVMVPNSLGPGELLLHYGTREQKDFFLPRLARGEEIPAFALTGPMAGSDAGAMPDVGVVCRGTYQGQETLGFRVNWSKRYITLGPICSLLGLAFKAQDPEGLLGGEADLGITCALIPADTPGVTIGERHDPGAAFQNGPNSGKDVFVPMEWVIGGQQQVGQGWKMLMDCLSVGRAISLPALGAAAGKACALTTGAYSRIRRQFRTPIGRFEGIEEALARIGGITYRMEAGRLMTAGVLAQGQKPSVLSAILKYNNTEGMRTVVNAAMDVHAGKAVCRGPANYLNSSYQTVPVAITVEGANILTRSMIVFGQGAIRCHPYVLQEMLAAADPDKSRGLADFDEALFAHIGFTLSNAVRALVLGFGGERFLDVPEVGKKGLYLRRISRLSAAFSFAADVAMLTLGGDLKRREKISGRFADVLSHLYLASSVIKHHEDAGRPAEDTALVAWAIEDSLDIAESRLAEIAANFPVKGVGTLIRLIALPLGRRYCPPSDRTGARVARLLIEPGPARERLTSGLFLELKKTDRVGLLELALQKGIAAEGLERKVRKATGRHVTPLDYEKPVSDAMAAGAINELEARALREAMELAAQVIAVDSFEVIKPAPARGLRPEEARTG
ncbi:MAG: acyl-CoA dehydrogenase [Gammaproteobacteria bacterium]|jgi:acyl-CoA dehydrogenase